MSHYFLSCTFATYTRVIVASKRTVARRNVLYSINRVRVWESKKRTKEVNFLCSIPSRADISLVLGVRGKQIDAFANRLSQCIVCRTFDRRTLNFVPSFHETFSNCHPFVPLCADRRTCERAPIYLELRYSSESRPSVKRSSIIDWVQRRTDPTHGKWSIRGSTV